MRVRPLPATLLPVLLVSFLLAGCSSDSDDSTTADMPTLVRSSETPEPEDDCTKYDLNEVVLAHLDAVPSAPNGSEWEYLDNHAYDPCLPLSWIQLVADTDAASYSQIMLFHEAQFVGTAEDFNITDTDVSRIDDSRIEVYAHYSEGYIRTEFVFNEGDNVLEKHPESPQSTATSAAPTTAATNTDTDLSTKFIPGQGQAIVFQTPTGNIGCAVFSQRAVCNVREVSSEMPKDASGKPYNTLIIESGGATRTYSNTTPAWLPGASGSASTTPDTLEYGDTFTSGTIQCVSKTEALTCTDTATGAGGSLSRSAITLS